MSPYLLLILLDHLIFSLSTFFRYWAWKKPWPHTRVYISLAPLFPSYSSSPGALSNRQGLSGPKPRRHNETRICILHPFCIGVTEERALHRYVIASDLGLCTTFVCSRAARCTTNSSNSSLHLPFLIDYMAFYIICQCKCYIVEHHHHTHTWVLVS